MQPQSIADIQAKLPRILDQLPSLKLMILFGSRARGGYVVNSDWDFAVLYDEAFGGHDEKEALDWLRIWSVLQAELQLSDDQVDIVILNQCSNILAHNIAREGEVIYEREPGEFEQFREKSLMSKEEQKTYIAEKRAEVRAALARWKS